MTIKTQNFPLTLALVSIISLTALNLRYPDPTVPILGFHGILDTENLKTHSRVDPDEMNYSQQELEKLLEYLINNDYWFLTTQDLYNFFLTKSQEIPPEYRHKKPIMLSFDDGYKSIHTRLFPVLLKLEKKYGQKIKIVLFINPGRLAQQANASKIHLSCQDLRSGLKQGFYDIQSHGLNHQDLTRLSRRELVNEILQARIILRKCTQNLDPEQKVASHFAYPYGADNKQVRLYVSRYYLSAYLYNNEILDSSCKINNYQIPRLIINYSKSLPQIIKMTQGLASTGDQKNNQQCGYK